MRATEGSTPGFQVCGSQSSAPQERLGAVVEDLFHLNQERQPEASSADDHVVEERRLTDQPGPAVDAQRVIPAWDQEQQADLRVAEDVPEPVEPPVARTVRDRDRGVVQHLGEARWVAFG